MTCCGHEIAVADVADSQWRVDNCFASTELQRVEHDDVAAGFAERSDRVRSDVASAASDQDGPVE